MFKFLKTYLGLNFRTTRIAPVLQLRTERNDPGMARTNPVGSKVVPPPAPTQQ